MVFSNSDTSFPAFSAGNLLSLEFIYSVIIVPGDVELTK